MFIRDLKILIIILVTLKVSKEKEIADGEEKKVGKINEEVSKKQRDCEKDLAKAEPALKAASEALNTLNKVGHCTAFHTEEGEFPTSTHKFSPPAILTVGYTLYYPPPPPPPPSNCQKYLVNSNSL